MAINPRATYPDNFGESSPAWPWGEPRNDSIAGAYDGSPWESRLGKDLIMPFHRLMVMAGDTPSGTPEDASTNDQFWDALSSIALGRGFLQSNGGTIVEGDGYRALVRGPKSGLRYETEDGTNTITVEPGFVDMWELPLPSPSEPNDAVLTAALTKTMTTWAEGDNVGGIAPGLEATAGMFRVFIVQKNGTNPEATDIVLDLSPTAAVFFASAEAIAAGYNDLSARYRRIGWAYLDGLGGIRAGYEATNMRGRFTWHVPNEDFLINNLQFATWETVDLLASAPPNTRASCSFKIEDSGSFYMLYRHPDQLNNVARAQEYSMKDGANIIHEAYVDGSGTFRVRGSSELNIDTLRIVTHGFFDDYLSQ